MYAHIICHVALIFDDVNDQAWVYNWLFPQDVKDHRLLKQFHIRGGHVPYMTAQLPRALRHRSRLRNKYKQNPNVQ